MGYPLWWSSKSWYQKSFQRVMPLVLYGLTARPLRNECWGPLPPQSRFELPMYLLGPFEDPRPSGKLPRTRTFWHWWSTDIRNTSRPQKWGTEHGSVGVASFVYNTSSPVLCCYWLWRIKLHIGAKVKDKSTMSPQKSMGWYNAGPRWFMSSSNHWIFWPVLKAKQHQEFKWLSGGIKWHTNVGLLIYTPNVLFLYWHNSVLQNINIP